MRKNVYQNKDDSNYTNLLGLFSHEYFHAWNVKTIKPKIFQPYDLEKENYTNQLWAFEGITSFYDDFFLLKAGLISSKKYLSLMAKNIDDIYQQKGHEKQTLAQSSFNAWTKYYKQDENNWNSIVSYYKKGALFAFCLDIYLCQKSQGKCSLNDVMRYLYQDYLSSQQGLTENDWPTKILQLTSIDVSDFLNSYVYQTTPLPLQESFAHIGVELQEIEHHNLAFGAVF
ncbi:hypothetical protein GKC56_05815 [Neisseriaceae bacterium PsAf]|nr:hypothetical protein [Neisseriaceae bacterium PsAf]